MANNLESVTATGYDPAYLPRDCIINILSRLSIEDRCRGPMLVCKSWRQACKDPSLYSVFDWETQFSPTQLSMQWTGTHWRTRVPKMDAMIQSVVKWSHGSLTEIRLKYCSNRSVSLIAKRCPKLEVLSIESSPEVTDEAISKIVCRCSNLRELHVLNCLNVSYCLLTSIENSFDDLKILAQNCSRN